MTTQGLHIVILAAGQGTRMRSSLPKVLHPLAGRPLLQHVVDTARQLQPQQISVVYGHGGEAVREAIAGHDIEWVLQAEQLGTGHAVQQAKAAFTDNSTVLVLYGDVPLLKVDTLAELVKTAAQGVSLLTVHLAEPAGYGRIVRDSHGRVTAIVEHKDASEAQRVITEVNTGILATSAQRLSAWLDKLSNQNAQGEYYLTDIIAMAVAENLPINVSHPADQAEVLGVNSRQQLAELERCYQQLQANALMAQGVTLADPARLDIRGQVSADQDVTLDINVVCEGSVRLGRHVRVGANCVLKDCELEEGVTVLPMCVIENARIGANSRIGPFARIRPGTVLTGDAHIGNFVEIKNSTIGQGSKVNHLTYIGDTDMGAEVNIGAGTITANYDGANKHRTTIEDKASTGSNSVLVAPVKVGKGATLGAGTVLRKDAPPDELTLTVIKQKTVSGWKRPVKKKD